LTYKLDLYIPTCTPKIKFLSQDFQKLEPERSTDIHTHRRNSTYYHSRIHRQK